MGEPFAANRGEAGVAHCARCAYAPSRMVGVDGLASAACLQPSPSPPSTARVAVPETRHLPYGAGSEPSGPPWSGCCGTPTIHPATELVLTRNRKTRAASRQRPTSRHHTPHAVWPCLWPVRTRQEELDLRARAALRPRRSRGRRKVTIIAPREPSFGISTPTHNPRD